MRFLKTLISILLVFFAGAIVAIVIFEYRELEKKMAIAQSGRNSFIKLEEIPSESINIYMSLFNANSLNKEILLLTNSSDKRMIVYHLESWVRLQVIKYAVSDNEKIELVFNRSGMGLDKDNLPIEGYFDAAEFYFAKQLPDLSLSELAQLFAIRKSPALANKDSFRLKQWRDENLDKMASAGIISEQEKLRLRDLHLKTNK